MCDDDGAGVDSIIVAALVMTTIEICKCSTDEGHAEELERLGWGFQNDLSRD